MRSAGPPCRRLALAEMPAHRRRIRARSGDEQVVSGKPGMLGEELGGPGTIRWFVLAVGQAGESEEPVGQRLVCRSRLAGGPGAGGHDLDVAT